MGTLRLDDYCRLDDVVRYFDRHPPEWMDVHARTYQSALRLLIEFTRAQLRVPPTVATANPAPAPGRTLLPRPDQYPVGTERGERPDSVTDPHGDVWVWTDADKRGVPGYQWAIWPGREGTGPAHTRDFVAQGRMCVYFGKDCPLHDHDVPAVEDS